MNFNKFYKIVLLISITLVAFFLSIGLFLSVSVHGHKKLETYLSKQLTKTEPLPLRSASDVQTEAIAYVLGGPQGGLKAKFETVAKLYHGMVAKKILLFSNPGITEYDPLLHRNLTNDEWVIKQLVWLGVDNEDIEFIWLKKRFFGTLTEAESISAIAVNRGYRQLILVTSDHHTLRTWLAFSTFLKDREVNLYIYGSHDRVSLRELLLEYVKLFLYKNVLLPISA